MVTQEVAIATAFFAGIASFFSPCIFPLLPLYISIIAPQKEELGKVKTLKAALLFIAGFTFVFILLGLTASALGSFLQEYQVVLRKVGGVFMVIMGLLQLGLIPLGWLIRDWRPLLEKKNYYEGGAFLLGMAFVFGWVPCTGPVLASILMYAGLESSIYYGAFLLLSYSLGFSIPLLVIALTTENIANVFRDKLSPYLTVIQKISGIILVIVGILLYSNWLVKIVKLFS